MDLLLKLSGNAVCFLYAITRRDPVQIVADYSQPRLAADQAFNSLHPREVAEIVLWY
jgi:hypothetical protein